VAVGQRQNIYQEGEVETWIAPLLRQAEKHSPVQGFKYQWNHRNTMLMWSLGSGVVLGLLLILISISRT
jgi:hypothetical protein